jgi:hypothetical protein
VGQVSNEQRPQITVGAQNELDNYINGLKFKIIHEAEKHTLKENRTEISEADMKKAKNIIPSISTSKRKWVIRIALLIMFGLVISQIQALSELLNVPLPLQIRLYLPILTVFFWFILFSYFFREDWL